MDELARLKIDHGEVLALLQAARQYVPSLTVLATRIDAVLPVPFVVTEQGKAAIS